MEQWELMYQLQKGMTGIQSLAGGWDFLLLTNVSRPALGPTQPPIQWVLGSFPPRGKAGHPFPSSAKVKNV